MELLSGIARGWLYPMSAWSHYLRLLQAHLPSCSIEHRTCRHDLARHNV